MFTFSLKATAKSSIPRGFRKSYVPIRDENCNKLYHSYLKAQTNDKIHEKVTPLVGKKRQSQWIETITSIDLRRSSRRAWNSLKRLTGSKTTKKSFYIQPNLIAQQVVQNGIYHRRKTKKIKLSHIPQNYSNNELGSPFKLWETGKAPEPDGILN